MIGILLAGGHGKRLYPMTKAISKQLLPIYDKPMIYYPLSVLMLAGFREVILISTKQDIGRFKELLGNGEKLGMIIHYLEQNEPNGIAESFIISEKQILNKNKICLILGDNVFYGQGLKNKLDLALERKKGATVYSYKVRNPKDFGVVTFDDIGKATSIEEKPHTPKSDNVITGLYFYDSKVIDIAKSIKPSKRNELEISDVNKNYMDLDELYVEDFGRGFAWLDTGTHESLLEASQFIQAIEKRQNLKIACIEEIACRNGWISIDNMLEIGKNLENTSYGKYIISIAETI